MLQTIRDPGDLSKTIWAQVRGGRGAHLLRAIIKRKLNENCESVIRQGEVHTYFRLCLYYEVS